jgi:hypothetical protein
MLYGRAPRLRQRRKMAKHYNSAGDKVRLGIALAVTAAICATCLVPAQPRAADVFDQWRDCVMRQFRAARSAELARNQPTPPAVRIVNERAAEIAFAACRTEEEVVRAIIADPALTALMKMRLKQSLTTAGG